MTYEKLCENLNTLMVKVGVNANELAKLTGLPASTIKKIRNNDKPNPTLSTLIPLAQYFAISLSQLTGEEALPNGKELNDSLQSIYDLPIISWTEAITWPATDGRPHLSIKTHTKFSNGSYALKINETDIPELPNGTILLIDRKVSWANKDIILVHKSKASAPSLKQAIIEDDKTYLKSLIEGLTITALSPEFRVLGVVVETQRLLKR